MILPAKSLENVVFIWAAIYSSENSINVEEGENIFLKTLSYIFF